MRVIGGTHRGRKLRAARGLAVRPTSDRLRETLFNILAPRIDGSKFMDLCAGSGAVGIEALSRGATSVTFVERSTRACASIEENLRALGLESQANIVQQEATAALRRLSQTSHQFDIVFFDPPYASEVYSSVMRQLGRSNSLSTGAVVVVEHRVKLAPEAAYDGLRLFREVKQGESALSFYER